MIMNEDLVTNIQQAKIPTLMTTNAGTQVLTTEADILNVGKAVVNILQAANKNNRKSGRSTVSKVFDRVWVITDNRTIRKSCCSRM